ncbi:MAG: LysR family transcriptional regulator [Bacteroidia bacterium]
MNYTLNQLNIFLTVAQTLNVTKAAEMLHLTQPAVSIQLKNFTTQFDEPLIEVVNKRIFLTEFGREIAAAAERILNEAYSINYLMHSNKGELAGKLRFSVVSTGKYVMPYFLSDFMNKHKGVELKMDVTNKAQVVSSLEKNEVDFSLVSVLPSNLNLEKIELMQNKLFLIGNTDKEFKEKAYKKSIFSEIPMIYRESGSATRLVMENFLKQYNLPVSKKMELTSNEAVKQAVVAGLGYSVMPLIGLKNELSNKQLQIIPVTGFPIITTWYLVWLRDKKPSTVAAAYLDYVRSEKANIIHSKFEWFEKY